LVNYSFSKKILQFSFSLGSGNFGGTGGNSPTVTAIQGGPEGPAALRATALIQVVGGPTSGTMEAAIYGLPLSLMNQLTTLGNQLNQLGQNYVSVSAGDDRTGLCLVFQGTIYDAYMDGVSSMPRVPFRFRATADGALRLKMIKPTSVQGQADVKTVMGQLAGAAGLQLQDGGVNVKVMNPYLIGAIRTQMSELASMAGIQHIVDRGKLAIWPTSGSRPGGGSTISPQTGMVGYPAFESAQVVVKMLFDPSFSVGQTFTVQSDVTPACGQWVCNKMVYDLESETPSGKWFQTLWGTRSGQQTQTSSR
jgi:hypothetical protein